MRSEVRLEGTALHTGGPAALILSAREGPITFEQRGVCAPLGEMMPERTDRGVALRSACGRVGFDLAEHLLAALGGLGVRRGVHVVVEGEEVPLLDGGARRFVDALRAIEAPLGNAPELVVTQSIAINHGASAYRFAPDPGVRVVVDVAFREPVGEQRAEWSGDGEDFAARIAPARTFGWSDEYAALLASGRARGVDLSSVLVFDPAGAIAGCRAAEPAEPARHKLLDLVGDFALYGGPPQGVVEAHRPGHTATHAIVREALRRGVLVRKPVLSSATSDP